ncbi:MAG: hypothetical protein ACYC5G_00070 [Candidatus Doudnabacteria bacterium]
MTEWEDSSSFELPEDESWRGDQHAPQGPDGNSISTWQPGMTADEADDLSDDDEKDDVPSDLEAATEEELVAACSPLAKKVSNRSYLIAYLIWMEQELHLQEIATTLRVSEKQARNLRRDLIISILSAIEAVCPTKTVDMDDALGIIYEEGLTIPCTNCGDQQGRYSKYCTSCGIENPDFCDELFQVFYGHSAVAEEEHRCPDTHQTAADARATGYCMVCGFYFPTKTPKP